MALSGTAEANLVTAIHKAMEAKMAEIVEQEAEEAAKRVKARVKDELAHTVLRAQQFYEISTDRNRITIEVRNGLERA